MEWFTRQRFVPHSTGAETVALQYVCVTGLVRVCLLLPRYQLLLRAHLGEDERTERESLLYPPWTREDNQTLL